MARFVHISFLIPLVLASALGCTPPPIDLQDAGDGRPDGFLPPLRDSGLPPLHDAGEGPHDDDGGPEPLDGGSLDAGPGVDSGPLPDAGAPVDAGPDVVVVLTSAELGPCYEAAGAVCEDGLVCAPYFVSGAGTCARPCATEGQACAGGGTCASFGSDEEPSLACATEVAEGAGCDPEQLLLCAGEGVCIPDDDAPLGGVCRTPCTCQTGSSCSTSACGADTCVVINLMTSSGYCGAAAQAGEACDPIGGGVFCEGDATCLIDGLGVGTCRLRCDAPGTGDPICSGLPGHACFGEVDDGFCLPTTNLGQGEACTDGTTTPVIALTCAAGFDCIHDPAKHTAGFGSCLEDCTADGDATCETGGCYDIDADPVVVDARCLSELPRGARGCDPLEIVCGDVAGVCVNLSDDSICKKRCAFADCPGGSCACAVGESCVAFLDNALEGVCGTLVAEGGACDEDADLYCAPAPGQESEGNAFAVCAADTCQYLCRYPDSTTGAPVDLACPAGMECAADPTGRLLPTVHVCRDPV